MWQRQALKRFINVCVRNDNKCACFGHTTICSNPDPEIPHRKILWQNSCIVLVEQLEAGIVYFHSFFKMLGFIRLNIYFPF